MLFTLTCKYNGLLSKYMIHHISFLFPDKGPRLMNYSQSTDYRQLSVDCSDSNSISESTSLILSNREHRKGKIFKKDDVCELLSILSPEVWDWPCTRWQILLCNLWLCDLGGIFVLSCREERYFYIRLFFTCVPQYSYIFPGYHVAPSPLSCFMPPLPGKAVQQITKLDVMFLAHGILTQKRWGYPKNAYGGQCQDISSEISWICK